MALFPSPRRRVSAAIAPALVVLAMMVNGGCSSESKSAEASHAATTQRQGVVWPELARMDEYAHEIEALVGEDRVTDLRRLAPEVQAAAGKLAASSVPAGAPANPLIAELKQEVGDLGGMLMRPSLSDDELKTAMEAIHPIVVKLMDAAAMPHLHDHDHDHEEHEHESAAGAGDTRTHGSGDIEKGPRGGAMVHLTPSLHGEAILDPDTGRLRVFAVNMSDEQVQMDDPMSVELELNGATDAGVSFSISLAPANARMTYEYVEGSNDALKGAASFRGRLTGKLRQDGAMVPIDVVLAWPYVEPVVAK